MDLFSDRDREVDEGRGFADPPYEYLDRSGRPMAGRIRTLLEGWYADYPDTHGDLQARFAQEQPDQHIGALLELYVHATFRQLGFDLEVHPDVAGTDRHPDFAVRRDHELVTFIECTTTMPSPMESGAERRRFELVDALNELESAEWSVGYSSVETGPQALSKRWFKDAVLQWLTSLDRERAFQDYQENGEYPERLLSRDGWSIVLQAIPLGSDATPERAGGLYTSEVVNVDSPTRLRRSIVRKASAYGNDLPAPLVVAVVPGLWYARSRHLLPALLGDEEWRVDVVKDEVRVGRKRNGAWFGPTGLRGERTSAVLYAPRFGAWRLPDIEWQLIHHPAPTMRLHQEMLPTAIEVTWPNDGPALERPASTTFRDLFALPDDWPGPEE